MYGKTPMKKSKMTKVKVTKMSTPKGMMEKVTVKKKK